MESSSFLLFLLKLVFLGTSGTVPDPSLDPLTETSSTISFSSNADLAEFTLCLKEKEVTFYGAFWCPHCQNQKALFGDAAESLPYVECSTPDGQAQTEECQQENIQSYPTWRFADGSEIGGEMTLEELSEKTGCLLPNS